MKQTKLIMGMPITVEVIDTDAPEAIADTFAYFTTVDEQYSTYKETSEISRINHGLPESQWSDGMKAIFALCEQTKQETNGYFDIVRPDGLRDPSGIVKGWAIQNAAGRLRKRNIANFYINAGGDIQVQGMNVQGNAWRIGIRNPFNREEIVKTLAVFKEGVATSGTYIRGQHIYNPHAYKETLKYTKSITVIGPNIFDADRFATAAFAMGQKGAAFIESLPGFEAYMIDENKQATYTSNFERYIAPHA